MKALITSILVLTSAIQSRASGSNVVTCKGRTTDGHVLTASVKNIYESLILLVDVDSQLIYSKQVRPTTYDNQVYYESANFKNSRNVPSSLQLLVYTENGNLRGVLGEETYLPVLPTAVGFLVCRK